MNVVQIKTTKSGTMARSITNHVGDDVSIGKFHEAITNAIADSNIVKIVCLLIDDEGAVHRFDKWEQTPAQSE